MLWFGFKCTNPSAGTKRAYAGWIRTTTTLTSLGKCSTILSTTEQCQDGVKKLLTVVFCTSFNKPHIFPVHLIVYLNLPHSGGCVESVLFKE